MRGRTLARKVHVEPGASPDLIYDLLAPENGKAAGLVIEEFVGDARQLRLVHQQDGTTSRVELPLPLEVDALEGWNLSAAPMKVSVKTNENSKSI